MREIAYRQWDDQYRRDLVHSFVEPDANKAYLWIVTGETGSTSASATITVDATNSSGSTTWLYQVLDPNVANVGNAFWGFYVKDYGASPPTEDILTLGFSSTAGFGYFKNVTLAIFELEDQDEYSYTAGSTATTSTSMADVETLTFTPASTGDYLIIGGCSATQNSTSAVHSIRFLDDTSSQHFDVDYDELSTSHERAWGFVYTTNLSAASKTFKIQQHTSSASYSVSCRYRAIVAIRLDHFDEFAEFYEASATTITSTYSTFQNVPVNDTGSTGFTPARASEFFLFGVATGHATGFFNRSIYMKLWQTTLGTFKESHYKTPTNATNHCQTFTVNKFTWTASLFTPLLAGSEGSGAAAVVGNSASGRDCAYCIIDTQDYAGDVDTQLLGNITFKGSTQLGGS